jgi:hypothetical protein
METAASLVNRLPALLVAVATPRDVLEFHVRSAPESQAVALIREGMIEVPALDETALIQQLQDNGAPTELAAAALRQLATWGADEDLVASLGQAACAVARVREGDEASIDRARSAAERFLQELLDSHPTTAGLFELNGTLDFCFGKRPAEIDFLARRLRLAVELDGYHWHMRDPEHYRRDRRKDWELQRHGYIVLRFLAEDVVCRLEEILDTIVEAVRHRRQSAQNTGDP